MLFCTFIIYALYIQVRKLFRAFCVSVAFRKQRLDDDDVYEGDGKATKVFAAVVYPESR